MAKDKQELFDELVKFVREIAAFEFDGQTYAECSDKLYELRSKARELLQP